MDWIKVKVGHCLYEYKDLSDSEFSAWIKIMSLTAIMEKIPSELIMRQHVHYKTLMSLQRKLKDHSTPLQDIIKKVLEDVDYTHHLRAKNNSRMSEWRLKKAQCNTLQQHVTLPVTLHIDEDKITKITNEDKGNKTFSFEDFWSLYPKKVGMSMAMMTFANSIKTEKDFTNLKTALKNYMASDEFKRGFVKNGDNWIEDWRGWLDIKPKREIDKYIVRK